MARRDARARPRRAGRSTPRARPGPWTCARMPPGTMGARHRRRRRLHDPDLQDPTYTGPSSTSWSEVTVTSSDPRRWSSHPDPARWLSAGPDPAARARPPPVRDPRRPAWRRRVRAPAHRSGPFARGIDGHVGVTGPSPATSPVDGDGSPDPSAAASVDLLASARSSMRPTRPQPYLVGIDVRHSDPDKLASTSARARSTPSRASPASSRPSSEPTRQHDCSGTPARR